MVANVEFKPVSMLERIKSAKSCDELLSLAVEATDYEYASDKTRRKWERATQDRKVQLSRPEKESKPKPKPRAKTDQKGRKSDR